MSQDIQRIKRILDDEHKWPSVFMFKFVVPSVNEKIARVEGLFNSDTAEIRLKQSAQGNYTSITVREVMTSADAVLAVYADANKIDGLIAL